MNHPISCAGAVAALALALGCGAPSPTLSPDSYLPVSAGEMEEALRAPSITCTSAATASGCAADPQPDLHPEALEPASAEPGVL